jgi:murein DD-endopeptidase MepM/ murein hydrolase activator NlpD
MTNTKKEITPNAKNMIATLACALLTASLLSACFGWQRTAKWILNNKKKGSIQSDSVSVVFPQGTFMPASASLQKVSNPSIQYTFDETAELFSVKDRSPFQYVLNIGTGAPSTDSIAVAIKLPGKSNDTLGGIYSYELFAQVRQTGGSETLDLFGIIPSIFDSTHNALQAYLPAWVFTNERNTGGSYEAIFTVATTPGAAIATVPTGPAVGLAQRGAATPSDTVCKASQIGCPIGSMADCKSKKTDGYGPRTHPITGVKGKMHWGVDFGIQRGTPIRAVADGEIKRVRWQKDEKGAIIGYGLYVVLRHTDGSATLYGHLSSAEVKVGDQVKQGQIIALSGNTGGSTNPHLHLDYVPNGVLFDYKGYIDPLPCISDNASGSIAIRDNGNLADDAFELYLDGILIGKTDIGASNSISISNLRPGDKMLMLKCVIAPDNVGTYEVLLQDGLTFVEGGGDIKSGILARGASVVWKVNVPSKPKLRTANRKSIVNSYVEQPVKE